MRLETMARRLVDQLPFKRFYKLFDELGIVRRDQAFFIQNGEGGHDSGLDLFQPHLFCRRCT